MPTVEEEIPRRGKEVGEILSLAHLIAELCLESPLKTSRSIGLAMEIAEKLVNSQMDEDYAKKFR